MRQKKKSPKPSPLFEKKKKRTFAPVFAKRKTRRDAKKARSAFFVQFCGKNFFLSAKISIVPLTKLCLLKKSFFIYRFSINFYRFSIRGKIFLRNCEKHPFFGVRNSASLKKGFFFFRFFRPFPPPFLKKQIPHHQASYVWVTFWASWVAVVRGSPSP